MLLSDYILQVQTLVHDLAGNDYTTNELTNYINNARTRVALDTHCVRSFFGQQPIMRPTQFTQLTLVANVEAYPINFGVAGVQVTNPGTGITGTSQPLTFTNNPIPGSVSASGNAIIANGACTGIAMTSWGTTYPSTAITVSIAGFPSFAGIGILLQNIIDINSITYLWPGSTNRQMLRYLPFTTFQAWCRAWVGQIGSPSGWTLHTGTNAIYVYPVPDQAYPIEIDAIVAPTALVLTTDFDSNILPPYDDAVQYYAAYIARTKLQDYEKADYWRKTYNTRIREINATRTDFRIPNIYRSSARRMLRW